MGSILATVDDTRWGSPVWENPVMVNYWNPKIVSATEHYPYGMLMRDSYASIEYRYGFNGKEYENEVQAAGNLLDYGNRLYDPLAGRFWSVDPLTRKFAMLTPYQYGSNNPVRNIDLDGLEGVVFQDVWNGKASVVDWINNPNAWKAGLDNISSVNPFWLGYVRSYEVITGKDYNTGEAKSRVSSAIEGTGDVMFSLTLGKFLKLPKASTSLEMQMSQTAKATGQPLATPAQQAVNTVEEKELAKLSNPVQQTAKAAPKPTPKFKTPTNPPQLPLKDVPEGMSIRIMKPTEQYPNGYWRLEKPMPQGGTQGINPATMKPGSQHETHVPLPEGYWNK